MRSSRLLTLTPEKKPWLVAHMTNVLHSQPNLTPVRRPPIRSSSRNFTGTLRPRVHIVPRLYFMMRTRVRAQDVFFFLKQKKIVYPNEWESVCVRKREKETRNYPFWIICKCRSRLAQWHGPFSSQWCMEWMQTNERHVWRQRTTTLLLVCRYVTINTERETRNDLLVSSCL